MFDLTEIHIELDITIFRVMIIFVSIYGVSGYSNDLIQNNKAHETIWHKYMLTE